MTRTQPNPLMWSAVLATAASFGSYFFACVFPFTAVATVAALTLSRRQAMGLITAVWAVNQFVGFAFLHYPLDSWALGGSLLAGGLAGVYAASLLRAPLVGLRSLGALAAAFVAYEVVTGFAAVFLGGLDGYAPNFVIGIAFNDLGWFLILGGAFRLLSFTPAQGAVVKA
ncbi:hypothetical protein SPAN111604_05720 [Sphingomonas antarctica]|uniref:hypothetical protein n=1 Tax=Sphingomonas antarctica TaxID=2040274 RepID=UPI0039E93CEA